MVTPAASCTSSSLPCVAGHENGNPESSSCRETAKANAEVIWRHVHKHLLSWVCVRACQRVELLPAIAFLLMPHWTKRFVQPTVHGSYKKLEWRAMAGVIEHQTFRFAQQLVERFCFPLPRQNFVVAAMHH